jgi:hypothetical protein
MERKIKQARTLNKHHNLRRYLPFDDELAEDDDGRVMAIIMIVTMSPSRTAPPIPADSPITQSS